MSSVPTHAARAVLIAVVAAGGWFWLSADDGGERPAAAPRAATSVPAVAAGDDVRVVPVERAAQPQPVPFEERREAWAEQAQTVQRELLAAMLSGDEAAIEAAKANAQALAARSR